MPVTAGNNAALADLIIKAAVNDTLADHTVSSDVYEALDAAVEDHLDDAAQRATQNDRKPVQARDLYGASTVSGRFSTHSKSPS